MNDTHTIHLTTDEYAYLMRLLGGASDQGIKTLGVGLTAVGVLELRDKMERAEKGPTKICIDKPYYDELFRSHMQYLARNSR